MGKRRYYFFVWLAVLSACAEPSMLRSSDLVALSSVFRYDAARGCIDKQGRTGLNQLESNVVFRPDPGGVEGRMTLSDRDAECVDLRGVAFEQYVGLNYAELRRWNLRGADLSGAKFFFANLLEADLRGTRLRDLSFGYARIEGVIDARTTLPPEHLCNVQISSIACRL